MKKIFLRYTSISLIICMFMTIAPMQLLASHSNEDKLSPPEDSEEYALWKENYIDDTEGRKRNTDSAFQLFSVNNSTMYNDYIEAYVRGENARYSLGTTEGNPNTSTDDYQKLTYGHPGGSTSETLIRIDDVDYYFDAANATFHSEGEQCVASTTIDDVFVKQILTFEKNAYTQRDDTLSIKYVMTNNSSSPKQIGGRIMIDTMLGTNDGAPFRIPGIGDVTTEMEFSGSAIPQYWQAFDSLSDPGVIASGTFYRTQSERPDKVQFAAWGRIYGSGYDYAITPEGSFYNDTAVAAYFDPISVPAGQSRTIMTYYGLSDFAFGDLTGELGVQVTAPSSLETNPSGTAYLDNPFTITAYVINQSTSSLSDVKAEIKLPPELVLTEDQTSVIPIGNLASEASRQVTWEVWATPQTAAKVLDYEIEVTTTSSSEAKQVPMTISLPKANYYHVNDLTVEPGSLSLTVGNSETLVALLNADIVAEQYEVRWESSNRNVAQVSSDGVVTAVGNGTANIKAISADNRKVAICRVIVAPRATTELDLWALSDISYLPLSKKHVGKTFLQIAERNEGRIFGDFTYITDVQKADFLKTTIGGFRIDDVCAKSSSLYAVSVLDLNGGVVIAYRGSVEKQDWYDDASFAAFDNLPEQFYDAWQFYREVQARHPGKTIRLTGHSLGGALAAFVSIMEDAEAITFNGADGLIIDLAYFINAHYVDIFNGIDKWKFTNHYNEKDVVGNRNPGIYRSIAHAHNSTVVPVGAFEDPFTKMQKYHSLESLVQVSDGKIRLTKGSESKAYLDNTWERTLNSFDQPNYIAFSELNLSPSMLNHGRLGRVVLGDSFSGSMLVLPSNLFEVRRNVVFTAASGLVSGTGSWWGDYYFFAKTGHENVYGRGGDDTYLIWGEGTKSAYIHDSAGDDTIWFTDVAMDEISVTAEADRYCIEIAGGTGKIEVDKKRGWFQPAIVIRDKDGATQKITDFAQTRTMASMLSAISSDENLRTIKILGADLQVNIYDENMTLLGSFSNTTDSINATDYATVFMFSGTNSRIEIDLMNNGRYVEVRSPGSISYAVYDQTADGEMPLVHQLDNIDLAGNAVLFVDNSFASGERNFVLTKDGNETLLSPEELKRATTVTADVSALNMFAGEQATVNLIFAPTNVITRFVDVKIAGSNPEAVKAESFEDGTVVVQGISEGEAVLTLTTLDGSNLEVSIPVSVQQDSAPDITATAAGQSYASGTWTEHQVTVSAALPGGYDLMYMSTDGQLFGEASGVAVADNGITVVSAFAMNSTTGRKTKTATYAVNYDDRAPGIFGVEDGKDYYIDRIVSVFDENMTEATINGVALNEEELLFGKAITVPGTYHVVATDASGKVSTVEFALKELPGVSSLTLDDAELVETIRHEFEDGKGDLSDDRASFFANALYLLEQKLAQLEHPDSSENEILSFIIEGQVGASEIDPDNRTITLYVYPGSELGALVPAMAVSSGASISPSPDEPQDFNSPVTYTVTAANGESALWTVTTMTVDDNEKPTLSKVWVEGTSLLLEFAKEINESILADSMAVYNSSNQLITANIKDYLLNHNLLCVTFDVDLSALPAGRYTVSIAENAISNRSSLYLDPVEMGFEISDDSTIVYYALNMESSVGGTITVGEDGNYAAGEIINLVATADTGYRFKNWTSANGGTFADENAAATTFTMPANATTITANFEYVGTGGKPKGGSSSRSSNGVSWSSGTMEVKAGTGVFEASQGIYVSYSNLDTTGALFTTVPYLLENSKTTLIKWSAVLDNAVVFIAPKDGLYEYRDNKKVFNDISGHWAANTISFITARELFAGVGENTFDPNGGMTRAMFATVLSRIEDAQLSQYTSSPFTDVAIDTWYGKAVAWAAEKGIINGYGNGLFGPDDLITREQMAVMLYNYMKYKGMELPAKGSTTPFADSDKVSAWAKAAVSEMKRLGLIGGVGNNMYAPQDTADRASVAQIFRNFITAVVCK